MFLLVTYRYMFGIMNFFRRVKLGLKLSLGGLGVLRNHPKLMVFPLVSGILSVGFLVSLLGPIFAVDTVIGFEELGDVGVYGVLFVVYFGTTFIATSMNAGLVHAVGESFAGKEPSVVRSLKAVGRNVGTIAAWSAIAATVGLLVRWLENRGTIGAKLVALVFAAGWSLMTFFVVPVIVFEDTSVTGMFSRSKEAYVQAWGESVGAGLGITVVTALGTLIAVVAAFVVPVVLLPSLGGIAVAALLAVIAAVLGTLVYYTLWGIVKTALYGYAKTGEAPEEFDWIDFETLGGTLD